MPTYINLTTNEYPRFPGDIALAPDDEWVEVVEVEPPLPSEAQEGYVFVPGELALVDGVYRQTWVEVVKPVDPRQQEIQKAIDAGIDLDLLGVIR